MSRIRTIKPEWVDDEGLHEAGLAARLMSVALISLADDYGNGRAHPGQLAGRVFWAEDNGADLVSESLARLSRAGFLTLYSVRGQSYYHVTNWEKHQRVDKPGKPRVPGPEEVEGHRESLDKTDVPEAVENPRETLAKVPGGLAPDRDPDRDRDPDPRGSARDPVRIKTRVSSLGGVPHPDRPGETMSSEVYVLEAFKALGSTLDQTITPTLLRRERRHLEELEHMGLELAPLVAESRGVDVERAFGLVITKAMLRYRDLYRAAADSPKPIPWKASWLTSRFGELTAGLAKGAA